MIRFALIPLILAFTLVKLPAVDLVAYWPLDAATTDSAPQGSTSDDGTFVGPETYVEGVLGQAITLNGANNYISIPSSDDLSGTNLPMTFSLWCKVDGFGVGARKKALFGQGERSGSVRRWNFVQFSRTRDLEFDAGGLDKLRTQDDNFDNGEWRHVVGVAAASGNSAMYVDGQLVDTGLVSELMGEDTPIFIGNNLTDPPRTDRTWPGEIDEVGIFQHELNQFEVRAIRDLALDPTYRYGLPQVAEIFRLYDSASTTPIFIDGAAWENVDMDPQDGRPFIRLDQDGSGVVGADGPQVNEFTADRLVIPAGLPLTFQWDVDPSAIAIEIDQEVGEVTLDTMDGVGSVTIDPGPTETTTYTLTATNAAGLPTVVTLEVVVTSDPLIDVFTLSDDVLNLGESLTVTYNLFNTETATLNDGSIGNSGTFTVSPTEPGRYILTASNGLISVTETLNFYVVQPSELRITEFLADNQSGLTDEEGDEEDWIQVTNISEVPTVIEGDHFLTDDPDKPRKWAIPNQTIAPGSSILVWASGKNTPPSPLHANFQLREEGEYLAITKSSGAATEILQEFNDYPKQFTDISYGIASDLLSLAYYDTPTPSGANEGVTFDDFVRDTKFSLDRGFYEGFQLLELSTATEGARIYFTDDSTIPSATNGTLYNEPIELRITTTIRAIAVKDGCLPTNVDTHSYIYPDWAAAQRKFPQPDLYVLAWPAGRVGDQEMDYQMQFPEVLDSTTEEVVTALQTIPSISVVMDQADLVDPETGIYARPGMIGRDWERAASVELLIPEGCSNCGLEREGFQAELGIRIRGGASRSGFNRKHSFRFYARRQYGERTLDFPLFGDEGTDSFRRFDLRTAQNYSWAFKPPGSSLEDDGDFGLRSTYLREILSRDTQRDLNEPYTRSQYVHLYLNGLYWGLYMTQERAEANHGAAYLGGDDDDYDTIKSSARQDDFRTEVADGNGDAWAAANNLAIAVSKDEPQDNTNYFLLEGKNAQGERDESLPVFIDIDNLIHYMQMVFYTGSFDGPLSGFLDEPASNNWFALRNRKRADQGFVFFAHDFEHSLGVRDTLGEDRTGPIFSASSAIQESFERSNPQYIHQFLMNNDEYRQRFADRTQEEFFNDGAFTNEAVFERISKRKVTVAGAIQAEVARWGDALTADSVIETIKRSDWEAAVAQMEAWITDPTQEDPDRRITVLSQLRDDDLFPDLAAPVFSQHGGSIAPGFQLSLMNPNSSGVLHYTLDGSDPRLLGGTLNPETLSAPTQTLNGETLVQARILGSDGQWSALATSQFSINPALAGGGLVVSEINYHPSDPDAAEVLANFESSSDFEFIEILNTSNATINLSGYRLTGEAEFSFPDQALLARDRVVLARNAAAFNFRYPDTPVLAPFSGKLSNQSGTLQLVSPDGDIVFSVTYRDDQGWDQQADGEGRTLILQRTSAPNDASSWRASFADGGNPGISDEIPLPSDPNGDSNGNGISNLTELLLVDSEGDYFPPTASIEPVRIIGAESLDYLVLTVKYRPALLNFSLDVERSEDLSAPSWNAGEFSLVEFNQDDTGFVTARYRSREPITNQRKTFARVRVAATP